MMKMVRPGKKPAWLVMLAALGCLLGNRAAGAAESIWNGSWTLDAARSSAGAKGNAADGYRFTLGKDETIKWEIPSLGEVVTGRTDGQPMAIHRSEPTPGLTLAVTAHGPFELRYEVARNGRAAGAGIMHIIEGGKAWVDVSWQAGKEASGGELVYVHQDKPTP
jgi:hypothetical protein